MAIQIQLRQGTTTEHNSFTGAQGELTYDTTLKSLVLHDGVTLGGVKIPYLSNNLVPSTMLPTATESVVGAVILNNTVTSTNATQALTAAQGKVLNDQAFGIGQNYSNVTASRVSGTTYTNSTTRPIMLSIVVRDNSSASGASVTLYVNSSIAVRLDDLAGGGYGYIQIVAVVPTGQTYKLDATGNPITFWSELR